MKAKCLCKRAPASIAKAGHGPGCPKGLAASRQRRWIRSQREAGRCGCGCGRKSRNEYYAKKCRLERNAYRRRWRAAKARKKSPQRRAA